MNPYNVLTSCKKLEKTNEQSLRYLKSDGWRHGHTDEGDYQGPLRVNLGSKMPSFPNDFVPAHQIISTIDFAFFAKNSVQSVMLLHFKGVIIR